eukprot:230971_1
MSTDCSTHSVLSRNVTITYAAIYTFLFVAVSVYSFHYLMKYDKKFMNSSLGKKLKIWSFDVWKRKRCYVPIVVHVFDQITDISVAIQFYILAQQQQIHTQSCGGLNMWYLFTLTVISILVYRFISSYLIYQATGSIQRFFSQLLDVELFRALHVNYLCNNVEPCDPQRWITTLEASLESSPQALIQIIYLVKTDTFNSSYLVVISVIFSLWSIVSKLISEDKVIVTANARNVNFKFNGYTDVCHIIILMFSAPVILVLGLLFLVVSIACCPCIYFVLSKTDMDFEAVSECYEWLESFVNEHSKWVSLSYVVRVIWRIFDVTSHLLLMTLIWIAIGGTVLTIKIVFEVFILLLVCMITKQWEILFAVTAFVMSTTTDRLTKISITIGVYRTCTNIMFMILISVWIYVDFECWRCTSYKERQSLVENRHVLVIFFYSWIAVILSPICLLFLIGYNVFKDKVSTSRQLYEMIVSENYAGILEIQLFCGELYFYDYENEKTLLMLAIQQRNPASVSYLLDHLKEYDQVDQQGYNAFDYYMKVYSNNSDDQRMKNNIIKIFKKHPNIRSVKGITVLLFACIRGDVELAKQLIDWDPNIINDKMDNGMNGATIATIVGCEEMVYYLKKTHNIHADLKCVLNGIENLLDVAHVFPPVALVNIYKQNATIRSVETMHTIFLTACHYGYLEIVKQLIDLDETVLKDTVFGDNGADIAHSQNQTDVVNYLFETHHMQTKSKNNIKIALFGNSRSGKSTMLNQMKKMHGTFTDEDIKMMTPYIQDAVIGYIKLLCFQSEKLSEQYDEKTNVEKHNEKLRKEILNLPSPYDLNTILADKISTIWTDAGIKETFRLRSTFETHDSVLLNKEYFLDKIHLICMDTYSATIDDVVHIRGPSKYECEGFTMETISTNIDNFGEYAFEFVLSGRSTSEQAKWMKFLFDRIHAVVFVVGINEYDLKSFEDNQTNSLVEAINVFKEIIVDGNCNFKSVLVMFNKYDVFKEKIKNIPITVAFDDFPTDSNSNPYDENQVTKFIASKFLECFDGKIIKLATPLHIHRTSSFDTDNFQNIARDITMDLVKLNLKEIGMM